MMKWLKLCIVMIGTVVGVGHLASAETVSSVLRENFKMVYSATQTGPILLYVKEGDYVEKGDRLFGVDPTASKLKVKLARVQWEQAQSRLAKSRNPHTQETLQREQLKFRQQEALYKSGGISKDAYQIAKLEYQLAIQNSHPEDLVSAEKEALVKELQLKLAQEALKKETIKAAGKGRVNQLLVQANEWVQPGKEVLELISIHPLYVVVNVSLKTASELKPDTNLELKVETGMENVRTQGVVKQIYDEVDAVSQTVRIRLEIDNETRILKPGMRAQVILP